MTPFMNGQFPLLNCTPHAIVVYDEPKQNVLVTIPASGFTPRLVEENQLEAGFINLSNGASIPVKTAPKYGKVEGLPELETCPDIIVSMLVGQELAKTESWPGAVYGPDMGKGAVRDGSGQIKGTVNLLLYCPRKVMEVAEGVTSVQNALTQ